MELEELKSTWNRYEQQITSTQRLSERLITSMLQERSRSRVAGIRRENSLLLVYLVLLLGVLAAIFIGNPFDFTYGWQYIPYGLLCAGVMAAVARLVKNQRELNTNINTIGLAPFLSKVIKGYEKSARMETWFGLLMFTGGVATVFSFLPHKLQHKGLWPALGETAIGVGITLLIYFVAFKAGAFRNRKKEGFENDLRELNELNAELKGI
ncbi:hypothetical protein [uncultured Chitinophaga sp.]|uniref:hypothetical protein n=1 Tax=uncultured Chitinophaga sp. TaxID=339340 RepID=UPI0025CD544E|nr:hypothetical protein [uncultured Chitinophaga sp.]